MSIKISFLDLNIKQRERDMKTKMTTKEMTEETKFYVWTYESTMNERISLGDDVDAPIYDRYSDSYETLREYYTRKELNRTEGTSIRVKKDRLLKFGFLVEFQGIKGFSYSNGEWSDRINGVIINTDKGEIIINQKNEKFFIAE